MLLLGGCAHFQVEPPSAVMGSLETLSHCLSSRLSRDGIYLVLSRRNMLFDQLMIILFRDHTFAEMFDLDHSSISPSFTSPTSTTSIE